MVVVYREGRHDQGTQTMKSRTMYMLIGIPYSGKTYYRDVHFMSSNYLWLSTDYIIEDIIARYPASSYQENWKDLIDFAQKMLYKDIDYGIKMEYDFVWDQTNLTKISRKEKLEKIPDTYQKIAVFFSTPSNETIEERKLLRPNQDIPWGVLDRMRSQLEIPEFSEGFDEIRII